MDTVSVTIPLIGGEPHILILNEKFQHRAVNLISFGVLASEFEALKSINMNCIAGEQNEFLGQNSKGYSCALKFGPAEPKTEVRTSWTKE